jgi:hypothetical protein
MRLQGSTDDFIVGRIFAAASDDAFDKVTKKVRDIERPATAGITDCKTKAVLADDLYTQINCALLNGSKGSK